MTVTVPYSAVLDELEAEAIHIYRETAAAFRNPVLLYSIGKDSSVLLHLAIKAFYPAPLPFPIMHIDTSWKFREMIEFRDRRVKELNLDLRIAQNKAALAEGVTPFTHGTHEYTRIMKTVALREGIDLYGFDAAIGGARRDEERSRAKERIFSLREPGHRWEGCLSAGECAARARRRGTEGALAWVRQLAWRDFLASVLLEHPGNLQREFQPRYRALAWDDDADALDGWRHGQTGYPIVDAGMRELAATGWMHNRARMVVGSFLTKDLHLDWRHGERHFSALLLDGEPAQNNGNWQWIASTGVDPAPYFRRMFNPVVQQRRFDPDGTYVRRWIPELAAVPVRGLAEPWTMTAAEQRAAGCMVGRDYPAPIVDHARERRRAIERYRAAGDAAPAVDPDAGRAEA